MLKAMKSDWETRFKEYASDGEMCLQAAYTGNLEEAEEFKKEIQEVFPGMEIHMDPLSLSVACHIGYGALAVAMLKKSDVISIKYRNKDMRSLKHEEDYGTDGGRTFRSI